MKTILIIVLVLAVLAGAVWVGTKFFGLTKDEDKDGIPDVVEDKVKDAKEAVEKTAKEVKRRARRVKEEFNDVKDAAKDVVDQAGDVVDAVKGGSNRKGRKPATKRTTGGNTSNRGSKDYYKQTK